MHVKAIGRYHVDGNAVISYARLIMNLIVQTSHFCSDMSMAIRMPLNCLRFCLNGNKRIIGNIKTQKKPYMTTLQPDALLFQQQLERATHGSLP